MKRTILIVAMMAIAASAAAFQPNQAAEVYGVWQHENRGSETVLHQNEQNDPSIHGRRTQTAYELGSVGQETAGITHDSTPVEQYPAEVGMPVIDEGYPAKECDGCHSNAL